MSTLDSKIKVLSILVGEAIKSVNLHPVKLELMFRKNSPYLMNMYIDHYIDESGNETLYMSFLRQIENEGWDTIVLPKTTLTIFSPTLGNKDDKGGGCGGYDFKESDFVWNITNESGITFRNIVEGVYRLKGSKYDYWYEMYTGIQLVEETDNGYKIQTNFDYYS